MLYCFIGNESTIMATRNTYIDEATTIINGLIKTNEVREHAKRIFPNSVKDQERLASAWLMSLKQSFACSFRPKNHLHREVFLVKPKKGATTAEHIVPIDTAWALGETLLSLNDPKAIEKLAEYLERYVGVKVHITNVQAATVNCSKANYKHAKNRMPETWRLGQCPSVRYACLGSKVLAQLQAML